MGQLWNLTKDDYRQNFNDEVSRRLLSGAEVWVEFTEKPKSVRTETQNRCMWDWCGLIAKKLNDAGLLYTIDSPILKQQIECEWDKDSVKERIWTPVQVALTGEVSSKKPSKVDYGAIEAVIARHLAETFGLDVPAWPSRISTAAAGSV